MGTDFSYEFFFFPYRLESESNLGTKSTPLDLTLAQLAFLTSAQALVKSSAEIFPAQ